MAFAVRLVWGIAVQSPFDALYSDMANYHGRAIDLLDGATRGDPRNYAFFPWGAHVLIALELAVVGRTSQIGVALVHALVGTIPVVCVVAITARVVRPLAIVAVAGLVAALWQPAVVHSGFFMSEMWFSAAIALGSALMLRSLEGKSGALGAGCAFAVAIAVRPQAMLTVALVAALVVVRAARTRAMLDGWARLVAPIALVLAFSAVRMHQLSGHWGLVSENGPLNRVFGATHIGRVQARWQNQYGQYEAWYTPPAKMPVRPEDIVAYEGYIGDAEILDRIREEHMKRETRSEYARRLVRNTRLLAFRLVFPEEDFAARVPFRRVLQRVYRVVLVNLLPIGAFGLAAMLVARRKRLVGIVVLANGLTVVVVAALYFAEARLRMPYDSFVIVGAAAGVSALIAIGKRVRSFVRERHRS
ncbi:MAG: hypothetical protein KIT84_33020 [Labilithrix sp.]|nr:hypothetical protein [Labilithrix sp.]MCW5815898.1 hypothetical protein [Labilithrix sp.]